MTNLKDHISRALLLSIFLLPGSAFATSVPLPAPLNEEMMVIERYWSWLKMETGAPANLTWPRIKVEPLPRTVRMAFFFPTEEAPWRETRIAVSPRSIDRAAGPHRLAVVGELAHELVHYVLVLKENGWVADAATYRNDRHHHCDPEFKRLTREIAVFLWNTYHSNEAVRSVEHMIQLACWRDGHDFGVSVRQQAQ